MAAAALVAESDFPAGPMELVAVGPQQWAAQTEVVLVRNQASAASLVLAGSLEIPLAAAGMLAQLPALRDLGSPR